MGFVACVVVVVVVDLVVLKVVVVEVVLVVLDSSCRGGSKSLNGNSMFSGFISDTSAPHSAIRNADAMIYWKMKAGNVF